MGVLLGASAHRAGLCTVKAVAEVMTSGQAHILWSFLKASFWTLGLLSLASLAGLEADLSARALAPIGMVGGVVFGIGAGLNGACSFSTLARLAEGHGVMLLTLVGWGLGLLAMRGLAALPWWLFLPGIAWMIWEGVRLVRLVWRRGKGILSDSHWPLSLGVFVVALANTGLLLMDRPWSFTSTAICASGAAEVAPCAHPATLWVVSTAAMLAMVTSAMLRGSFRIRRVRLRSAVRRLGAGCLMGAGAAMIPGGNDGLILFGIPSLSSHALPSWFGIVAGIWMALVVMRALGARVPRIFCEGDICRAEM
ncbi:MAG: YeeE/YedE thiosulfate transporter family protein [Paracoccaceae bacterium]|nr:YeeE/YedE thiosulfate transporter family protein [Paracoccaceae bacterium]